VLNACGRSRVSHCAWNSTPSHAQTFDQSRNPIDVKRSNSVGRLGIHNGTRSSRSTAARNAFFQVPRAWRRFCPRFYEMGTTDKRTFWLISSRACRCRSRTESNTSVRHSELEGALAMRSEGLLQLAYADHKRYGCDFNWQVDRSLKTNDRQNHSRAEEQSRMWSEDSGNQIIVHHKPLLTPSGYCRRCTRTGRASVYSPRR